MRSPAKIFFETILIIAVVIAFAVVPLTARAGEEARHGPVPFAEFDADGDGFVSEEEFNTTRGAHMAEMAAAGRPMKGAASAPAFADLDSDDDGKLSEEELAAGHKAHMQAMRGKCKCKGKGRMRHRHEAGHGGRSVKMPTFEDIDTDGDGSISREEFAAHQASHHGRENE